MGIGGMLPQEILKFIPTEIESESNFIVFYQNISLTVVLE